MPSPIFSCVSQMKTERQEHYHRSAQRTQDITRISSSWGQNRSVIVSHAARSQHQALRAHDQSRGKQTRLFALVLQYNLSFVFRSVDKMCQQTAYYDIENTNTVTLTTKKPNKKDPWQLRQAIT